MKWQACYQEGNGRRVVKREMAGRTVKEEMTGRTVKEEMAGRIVKGKWQGELSSRTDLQGVIKQRK